MTLLCLQSWAEEGSIGGRQFLMDFSTLSSSSIQGDLDCYFAFVLLSLYYLVFSSLVYSFHLSLHLWPFSIMLLPINKWKKKKKKRESFWQQFQILVINMKMWRWKSRQAMVQKSWYWLLTQQVSRCISLGISNWY